MERSKQLSNVAFGGDWSEGILHRETAQACIGALRAAVQNCLEDDPRTDAVWDALQVVRKLTRGDLLADAFWRAGGVQNPGLRVQEMQRCLRTIISAMGAAAQ